MKTYLLTELGYLTEKQAEKITRLTDNSTYMNIRVFWSGDAGNCTLCIMTDYDAPEEEIRTFYISYMIRCLTNEIFKEEYDRKIREVLYERKRQTSKKAA